MSKRTRVVGNGVGMKGSPADVKAIALEGDRPVDVGAEASRAKGSVAFLHFFARQIETIGPTDAEYHEMR